MDLLLLFSSMATGCRQQVCFASRSFSGGWRCEVCSVWQITFQLFSC